MISDILKEETKLLHAETEKSLNAKRIFSKDFTLKEYVQILQILYTAHVCLETRLENIIDSKLYKFYKSHYTPHYHLIKRDLEYLNATAKENSLTLSKGFNDKNALGILYVLKGSSMGAKFINKQLQETAGKWSNFSGEFYRVSASQTMDEWKNFCSSLESLNLNPVEVNEVIDGAKMAFKTFIEASVVVPE